MKNKAVLTGAGVLALVLAALAAAGCASQSGRQSGAGQSPQSAVPASALDGAWEGTDGYEDFVLIISDGSFLVNMTKEAYAGWYGAVSAYEMSELRHWRPGVEIAYYKE
jgi:hypothetical protein